MGAGNAIELEIDTFGGLVTQMSPETLPEGASYDCPDCQFIPGEVRTRPGLQNVFTALAGNPTINYQKTFTPIQGTNYLLLLDSTGTLWAEKTIGVLSQLGTGLITSGLPNPAGKSVTLFQREYIAVSDGNFGTAMPLQWDGTNLDRVSQQGPGAPPTAVDAAAEAAVSIAAPATGAVRSAGNTTITTTTNHGYLVGQNVTIAGVTDASFNGTFTILTVPSATTFTYNQAGSANATSGNGTATLQPQVVVGVHQIAVSFITRQNYITHPSPPGNYLAQGGRRASVSAIPTGPANVIGRIVMFTLAAGASFSYIPSTMIINDNTTTTLTVDFSDSALAAGQNADGLFKLVELGECAGVIAYANRLHWWGERNKVPNFLNMGFDGGWNLGGGVGGSDVPLGWTSDATNGAGASRSTAGYWMDGLKITGDGVAATRGMVTQPAFQDYLGTRILQDQVAYSARARFIIGGGITVGNINVQVFSPSAGILGTMASAIGSLNSTTFTEIIGSLFAARNIPTDTILRVFASSTPSNGGFFIVDAIELYPTNNPSNTSLIRSSQVNNPEGYDGVTGLMQPDSNDGQMVRSLFRLRENLLIAKDRRLFITSDDGTNEPAKWQLTELSNVAGAAGVNAADSGEEYAFLVNEKGFWITEGSSPITMHKDIDPPTGPETSAFAWHTINWAASNTIWVVVDKSKREVRAGVPYGAATTPNKVIVMSYRSLPTASAIGTEPPVHFSTFTGRWLTLPGARQFSIWNISANSAAMVLRPDGTEHSFFGNGAGTGKVYDALDTQLSDDGVAINGYYATYFTPSRPEEEAMQLGGFRKYFAYQALKVEGAGTLNISSFSQGQVTSTILTPLTLSSPAETDAERLLDLDGARRSFKFGTNTVGAWFRLMRVVTAIRKHPTAPVRGI